jgi:hypothetical protein
MRRLTLLAADVICGSAPRPTQRLAAARQRNRCAGMHRICAAVCETVRRAHWRRNLASNPLALCKQETLFTRAFFDRFGLQTASLRPERDRGFESRSLHRRVMCELDWRAPKRARMTAWLDENCGADGWAMTPSGMRGVLNDAVSIYFPRPPTPVLTSNKPSCQPGEGRRLGCIWPRERRDGGVRRPADPSRGRRGLGRPHDGGPGSGTDHS